MAKLNKTNHHYIKPFNLYMMRWYKKNNPAIIENYDVFVNVLVDSLGDEIKGLHAIEKYVENCRNHNATISLLVWFSFMCGFNHTTRAKARAFNDMLGNQLKNHISRTYPSSIDIDTLTELTKKYQYKE